MSESIETPAVPEPGVVAPVEAKPAKRPVRVWDIVLTIALLVVNGIVAAFASFAGVFLVMGSDSCGASSVCNYDIMGTGIIVGVGAPWVGLIIAIILSIVLLVLRRIAFWVPIVGMVLSIGGVMLGAAITFAGATPA